MLKSDSLAIRKVLNNMNNNKIKIIEPNKGKHMAVPGQINTIVVSKEDTGGTYSFIECKVFPGAVLCHTFKRVNMKVFT